MYSIGQLSQLTGVTRETIRYYERIDLLPRPKRSENGYRQYSDTDVDRLRFARSLDFSLDEIRNILALNENHQPPCQFVLDVMERRIAELDGHIKDLIGLLDEIKRLHRLGQELPEDVQMKTCVCHLIITSLESPQISEKRTTVKNRTNR